MATPHQSLPDLPPPATQRGLLGWLRENLFSTWYNSILTVVIGYWLVTTLVPLIDWAFFSAVFTGEGPQSCAPEGACWIFVYERLGFFLYGFYPEELRWRPDIAFLLFAITVVPQFFPTPAVIKKWLAIFGLTGLPVAGYILIAGGHFGLEPVATSRWGGLMLTLILAYVGIIAAMPIGTALALGRRHANRHCTGFGPALRDAHHSRYLRGLYRILAGCPADNDFVHGLGDAATLPPRGRDL